MHREDEMGKNEFCAFPATAFSEVGKARNFYMFSFPLCHPARSPQQYHASNRYNETRG